jgi:probable HAF family extracellular repeat protein
VNIWAQAVGQADTQTPDPNGEDFCGSTALGLTHSGDTCVPFLWQNGTMAALPRLRNSAGTEGSNGAVFKNNDFGMVVGTAENGEVDSTCPGASISPQRIEFKPVIWSKQFPWSEVLIQEFPTVYGDPDGVALAINDLGQVAGTSGPCGPFSFEPINLTPLHAVLWQNGKATDLGNLGGDGKFLGIFATSLNDYGQVVGGSDTTNDASFHGFLWQQGHITDLKPRAVDSYSVALAIGNNGLVLGASIDANFIPTAVLWRNGGTPTDMNTLVPADSTLNLQTACSINHKGEIIGFAALKRNPSESHAYLAKPVVNSGDRD